MKKVKFKIISFRKMQVEEFFDVEQLMGGDPEWARGMTSSTWPGNYDTAPSRPDVSVGRVTKHGGIIVEDRSGEPDSTAADEIIVSGPKENKSTATTQGRAAELVPLEEVEERMSGDPEWSR